MIVTLNFEVGDNCSHEFILGIVQEICSKTVSTVYKYCDSYIVEYHSDYDHDTEIGNIRCLCIAFEQACIAAVLDEGNAIYAAMIGRYGTTIPKQYRKFSYGKFITIKQAIKRHATII